jgi:hypothetical protein
MYAGGRLDFVAGRMADPGGGELAFDEVYVRRTATVSGSEKQEMLETVESLAGAAAGHGPAPTGMTGRVECVVFYSGYVYRSEPDIRPLSGGNEQPDGLYSPIDRLVRQCERVFQYNIDFGEFHLFNEEARKKSLLYYEMKLFGVLGWLDE